MPKDKRECFYITLSIIFNHYWAVIHPFGPILEYRCLLRVTSTVLFGAPLIQTCHLWPCCRLQEAIRHSHLDLSLCALIISPGTSYDLLSMFGFPFEGT